MLDTVAIVLSAGHIAGVPYSVVQAVHSSSSTAHSHQSNPPQHNAIV
ncbi:hypothetical protein [Bacillus subtilis]|nr:hypothetical protein [Bacillus subtilis]